MRRDFRKKSKQYNKIITYSIAGLLTVFAIVFALVMYGNSINDEVRNSKLSAEQIANIVKNESNTESASSNMGKTVEEQEDEISNTNSINLNNTTNEIKQDNTSKNNVKTNTSIVTTSTNSKNDNQKSIQNNKKELVFQKPLEGEIIRDFSQDNLVYSETLSEWVTHNGIDIKADKATVVQTAEDGVIKTIKNDPRYGLTIVIEHEDGFQTVYANLLSSEFVTEGEKVTKGQAIGTVGNTAAFESADEPHLHFEVIKESVQVDPSIYIK